MRWWKTHANHAADRCNRRKRTPVGLGETQSGASLEVAQAFLPVNFSPEGFRLALESTEPRQECLGHSDQLVTSIGVAPGGVGEGSAPVKTKTPAGLVAGRGFTGKTSFGGLSS
jgi:hypothetical protein